MIHIAAPAAGLKIKGSFIYASSNTNSGRFFMSYKITLIPGDGVGPQIVEASRRVIDASGVTIDWEVVEAGEALIPQYGTPLP
jgi:isocitrate dehydrogenase